MEVNTFNFPGPFLNSQEVAYSLIHILSILKRTLQSDYRILWLEFIAWYFKAEGKKKVHLCCVTDSTAIWLNIGYSWLNG